MVFAEHWHLRNCAGVGTLEKSISSSDLNREIIEEGGALHDRIVAKRIVSTSKGDQEDYERKSNPWSNKCRSLLKTWRAILPCTQPTIHTPRHPHVLLDTCVDLYIILSIQSFVFHLIHFVEKFSAMSI